MGYAFISYGNKQLQDAERLRLLLHAKGIDTWMAPYDIPDDSEYADEINAAIRNSACVVLLLTEDAQSSTYVDKEIERALHYGKTIAPIQLEHLVLNDSFSFYLCNQQIVMVTAIDESVPQMKTLLAHLQYLCNDQLPEKEEPVDPARDKRVRRQRISRIFMWSGLALLCVSLFCGYRYVYMIRLVTWGEMYNTASIPAMTELVWSYIVFFLMAVVAVLMGLYGVGLRDPQKKTWHPLAVLSVRSILPGVSVLCGVAACLLTWLQESFSALMHGLVNYHQSTAGYDLPQWVPSAADALTVLCIAGIAVALATVYRSSAKKGFQFIRSLNHRNLKK